LCNEVAGIGNSQEIISCLEKNNIFVNVLDDEKMNYRYHSLFADFLRSRLMKSNADTVMELYLKASRWYEKSNMMQEAMDYSIRSNNHQNTARLIEKYGEIMIIDRDSVKLTSLIESLPENLIAYNAKLCTLYTMAVAGKNASRDGGVYVGDLFVCFKDDLFKESEVELLLIRTISAYANEDFKTALEYGNQIFYHAYDKNVFKCLLYKILIQIYSIIGDSEKCEYCLSLYIDSIRKKNHYNELFIDITYTHMMVHIQCGMGKYKEALELLIRFEEGLGSYNILLPAMASSIYLDLGYLYYEFGKLESSCKNIERCIEISSIKMDLCRLISGYILVAKIKERQGEYEAMMKFIKKVDDLCDKYNGRLIMNNMIAYIIRPLLSAGKLDYVEYLIRKYGIEVQDSYDVLYEEVHIALADLYIVKGELCKAGEILDKLCKEVAGTDRNLSYVRIMLLISLLSKCKGNEMESVKYMKAAIKNASAQRYISTFADYGTSVAEIICKMMDEKQEASLTDEEINYVSCILSHIREPQNQEFKADLDIMKCLSKRESEVLEYILNGLTNKEIASRLYIAECTVKKHINNIYAKIGATNRDQVIKLSSIYPLRNEICS